jgi:hypothetical protein
VDLIEAYVAAAARSLVSRAEKVGKLKVDLGPNSLRLVTIAREVLDLDRALVRLAEERAAQARGGDR